MYFDKSVVYQRATRPRFWVDHSSVTVPYNQWSVHEFQKQFLTVYPLKRIVVLQTSPEVSYFRFWSLYLNVPYNQLWVVPRNTRVFSAASVQTSKENKIKNKSFVKPQTTFTWQVFGCFVLHLFLSGKIGFITIEIYNFISANFVLCPVIFTSTVLKT